MKTKKKINQLLFSVWQTYLFVMSWKDFPPWKYFSSFPMSQWYAQLKKFGDPKQIFKHWDNWIKTELIKGKVQEIQEIGSLSEWEGGGQALSYLEVGGFSKCYRGLENNSEWKVWCLQWVECQVLCNIG